MKDNYTTYQPRKYILETLSPKACYDRIIESFNVFLNGISLIIIIANKNINANNLRELIIIYLYLFYILL